MRYDKQNKKIEKQRDEIKKLKEINSRLESKNTHIQEVLNSTLHEVRRFSSQLSKFSEKLSRQTEEDSHIIQTVQSIFYTAGMISSRLAYTDIELNPSALRNQTRLRSGIYKKFDKASRILAEDARSKNLKIEFSGESRIEIDALPVFELLPFVLIDNAIKYSPENQQISINFEEKRGQLTITIKNFGPSVAQEEVSRLFEKKFRGVNVGSMPGEGLGLFLAKRVCEFHGINIKVEVGQDVSYSISGISYSEIVLTLDYKSF